MIKLVIYTFLFALFTPISFSQELQVKWGSEFEGFERVLRIDDDGIYCFFSEAGKRKKITPVLVKLDNNLNRVFSQEISTSEENVYLNDFFALRNNFVFVTRIDDSKLSTYHVALIDTKGEIISAKQVFQTKKVYNTVNDGMESSHLYVRPSEDSTHILMYYNTAATDHMYNQKSLNANEEIQFAVYDLNLDHVYTRTITPDYSETNFRNYSFLLSKDNKLITYSALSTLTGGHGQYWEEKRGKIKPRLQYLIHVYGKLPHEDKEISLPQNHFMFYRSFKMRTLEDGNLYLSALGTNLKEGKIQGVMIYKIDPDNTTTPEYFTFTNDIIERINLQNEDKTNKKEPGLHHHNIKTFHKISTGGYNISIERFNGLITRNATSFELNNGAIQSYAILRREQRAHGIKNTLDPLSYNDLFLKDRLWIFYNDHSDNLNTGKNKFFIINSNDFLVVAASFIKDEVIKKALSEKGNEGFHLIPKYNLSSGNKAILVTKKDEKFRLGIVTIN